MRHRNKVTALVPAYQSAEFIQKTLDSLSLQTQGDYKVIISVDLCEDETYEICLDHCSKDSRFHVIRQDRRLGYVGNCNFLLDQANSDYVLFAFNDDILDASYVEKLCAVLDKDPKVIMTFSKVLYTEIDGQTQNWGYQKLDGIEDRVERGLIMLSRKGRWQVPDHGIFRLDEARKIQGLKTHAAGEFSTDWPWLFHMTLLGQFQSVPGLLCNKIRKKGSLMRSWAFSKEQRYAVTVACMREIWISPLSIYEKTRLAKYLLPKLWKLLYKIKKQSFKSSLRMVC